VGSVVFMKSSNKILWTIFLTIFIDMFGIGILIPIFPLLIIPHSIFKVTPDSWTTAQGFIMAGWLMSAFPLAQFLCTPILGQLADRYGRKKVLAFSIGGTAISYALFALGIYTKSIPLLFFARILDGISGGNISVAQAVIGDVSNAKNRAKNFGLVGVSIGIGFILGPFIGGKLSDPAVISWFDAATPFWFAAFLSIINVVLVLTILPETLQEKSTKEIDMIRPIHNMLKILKHKQLLIVILSNFLFNAGFTFFTTFWGITLAYQFNFTQSGIGDFYGYIGIMIVLAQGGVVRHISGKVLDYKVLNYSIILTGVCLLGFYFISKPHVTWIYYITPLLAIFMALSRAFNMALLSRVSTNSNRGEIMGINSSATALAQAIPGVLAGYIATHHITLTILVGAFTTICGGLLFRFFYKDKV